MPSLSNKEAIMSTPTLATRLAVHACHDLASECPKTIYAMANWLEHTGFWLAELSEHPRTPDQVAFMTGLLGLALAPNMGVCLAEACRVLRDEMVLQQVKRQFIKEAL